MNIKIITLSCALNYGAVLQTYALYHFLEKKGYNVQVIDYITERYTFEDKKYPQKVFKHSRWGKNFITRFIWQHTYYSAAKKSAKVFREFLSKNIKLTKTYYSNDELRQENADIFITGSDQIWNTDFSWDKKIDLPYFLDFVDDDTRKISYSSSFGKSELRADERSDVYSHLKRFAALGVREDSAQKILEDLGLSSTVVADPTLLLSKEEWSALAGIRQEKRKYVLLFQITPNKAFIKFAKRFADKKGLKLVIVSPSGMQRIKIHCPAVYLPNVEEWLSYFKYADYVITDSFHATAFSTIYEKEFYTASFAGYNSRLTSFLNIIGLTNRLLSHDDVINNVYDKAQIDYNAVRQKKDKFVEKSQDWLLNQIE